MWEDEINKENEKSKASRASGVSIWIVAFLLFFIFFGVPQHPFFPTINVVGVKASAFFPVSTLFFFFQIVGLCFSFLFFERFQPLL